MKTREALAVLFWSWVTFRDPGIWLWIPFAYLVLGVLHACGVTPP